MGANSEGSRRHGDLPTHGNGTHLRGEVGLEEFGQVHWKDPVVQASGEKNTLSFKSNVE